ncbi:TPA: DUF1648 domain-containing protein [Staphylococcus argenteus]|uniref:DUF1648 domain-containing protein n=1 Tax=Staphylococcus argenteus TaxID=985002 RepID=UPI000233FC81|nr:DUF1648 domain-containing protein [Staphylococcus argenteus]MBE2130961.1 DUF1648 domain-containing protein [Staphylococcus argenteus]PNY93936.1 DUF1648 domain-containing protein [Staphylococcus argenteus]CCE57938.1 putative membrane protein [Staphylococcus argenteus]SUJ01122.1 Predicted membrane protein [Staphylococcus argenteus]HDY9429207.1 DUF1648 domain-containing protein [Staphylococcus argenteus]
MSKIRSFTILSLLIYLVMMCYTVMNYSKLPSKVPIHYNLAGNADDLADKWVLLLINAAFIVIWLIFFIAGRYYERFAKWSHYNHTPREIQTIKLFLSTLNLEIMSYISIFMILEIWQIQHNHQLGLLWFNMIFIIIIGLTLVVFCLLPTIHKMRDSQ